MNRHGPPSEIARLIGPMLRLIDAAWRRMHWWIATMAVLYLLSGVTVVRADETAIILRWGRLVGDTPALQEHGPGLLFAFPRPVDQVVRVSTKRISEVRVTTLAPVEQPPPLEDEEEEQPSALPGTLDPLVQGYAVTGDENIVHVDMVARYRVREPALWAFYGPKANDILRVEVTAAMVRSLGEMDVDRVLSDGRKVLIATATRRAQAGLDATRSGLELASLELTRLSPPLALAYEFSAVQSAYIDAETRKKEALAYAERAVPDANAQTDAALQAARAAVTDDLSVAKGESEAFRSLAREYKANPAVVRERLYRDAIDRVVTVARVRWIPPPVGGAYHGSRITISPLGSSGSSALPGGP